MVVRAVRVGIGVRARVGYVSLDKKRLLSNEVMPTRADIADRPDADDAYGLYSLSCWDNDDDDDNGW